MITLTFEEYDELEEQIENLAMPNNYIAPTIQEIEQIIISKGKAGVILALKALVFSTDEAYNKAIHALLRDMLTLVSKEVYEDKIVQDNKKFKKFSVTKKSLSKIMSCLNSIDFKVAYAHPTQEEIISNVNPDTEEGLAFLIWLSLSEVEFLDAESDRACKDYILSVIRSKTQNIM